MQGNIEWSTACKNSRDNVNVTCYSTRTTTCASTWHSSTWVWANEKPDPSIPYSAGTPFIYRIKISWFMISSFPKNCIPFQDSEREKNSHFYSGIVVMNRFCSPLIRWNTSTPRRNRGRTMKELCVCADHLSTFRRSIEEDRRGLKEVLFPPATPCTWGSSEMCCFFIAHLSFDLLF